MSYFFFFSSRRRHTRFLPVSWARRCVQETGQKTGTDYVKFKTTLTQKKEKLFAAGDINRWEIPSNHFQDIDKNEIQHNRKEAFSFMLPRETAIEHDLRDQFAFYNEQLFKELSRCFDYRYKEYARHFAEFSKLQSSNVTEFHVIWADVLSHFEVEGGLTKPIPIYKLSENYDNPNNQEGGEAEEKKEDEEQDVINEEQS
eukprot:TRINITY_DN1637_c0_g1_i5.p2 TRINITY_DN1637_c0_g1~~TRINITY_DN1637_c0_g1_i5.p2  ORF type:complete len:200 (-),score=53.70 TRINITY_DN1637_c0_g1_i5:96-695(-)